MTKTLQVQTPVMKLLLDGCVVEDTLSMLGGGKIHTAASMRWTTTQRQIREMKCCNAFAILTRKQLPIFCSVRVCVVKALNYKYKVTMKRSDVVDSASCHEPVEKPLLEFREL